MARADRETTRPTRGETMVETLMAMLVIVFASVIFATSIGAASAINKGNDEALASNSPLQQEREAAERRTAGEETSGAVTISQLNSDGSRPAGGGSSVDVDVDYYGGSSFVSYRSK